MHYKADKIKTGQQVLSFSIGEIVKSKGWDMERAIITPPAKNAGQLYEGKSVLQWSKDPQCQVSYKVLNSRLKKGMRLATALKA